MVLRSAIAMLLLMPTAAADESGSAILGASSRFPPPLAVPPTPLDRSTCRNAKHSWPSIEKKSDVTMTWQMTCSSTMMSL